MNKLVEVIKRVCEGNRYFLLINDGFAAPSFTEDGKFIIHCVVTGIKIHQDEITGIGAVSDSSMVFDTNSGAVEMCVCELKSWFNN